MIKDTFFSAPRFTKLLGKEMIENWKSNVLRALAMYGLMSIVLLWNGYFECQRTNTDRDTIWPFALLFFMWSLWGFGCLSASFTMEKMKTKTSRTTALMTPATSFEKFFSSWVVYTVVFLIVFLIAFKLADYTRVLVYWLAYSDVKVIAPVPLSGLVDEHNTSYELFSTMHQFMFCIAGYLLVQSCFVLGSSISPKNAFLKTFAACTLIIAFYGLVKATVSTLLFGTSNIEYYSTKQTTEILTYICCLFACINWTLAYFRFKESEIINRI